SLKTVKELSTLGGPARGDRSSYVLEVLPASYVFSQLAAPVAQTCSVFNLPTAAREQRSADYKSAIRQIKNLRYAKHVRTRAGTSQRDVPTLGPSREGN